MELSKPIHFFTSCQAFSLTYFLMLSVMGLGTLAAFAHSLTTSLHEQFPRANKAALAFLVCAAEFLLGTVFLTPVNEKAFI